MTNEEWKTYNDQKLQRQKEGECSRLIGNALRYLAFTAYMNGGCKDAVVTLSHHCKNKGIVSMLSEDIIGRIKRGILAELLFYRLFGDDFLLTPTLDAGCAFDFIGKIPLDAELDRRHFARIDVTRSIAAKRECESITCRGQTKWEYRIAHVRDKARCIDWYDECKEKPLLNMPFPKRVSSQRKCMAVKGKINVSFSRTRREALEKIECAHSLEAALAIIRANARLRADERCQLQAEAFFFEAYKYALNIVPALSCGDLCDFIGEHDGELVRYRILTRTEQYFHNERPILEQLSQRFKYKVALFNSENNMFSFHDWNDCKLFDDISDF